MSVFENLFSLKGKTALITGGATGIGHMIASALVEAGASVMIASRKEEDCKKAAFELNQLNASGTAISFKGDVSSEKGVEELVAHVTAKTDRLDILINNAGTSWGQPIGEFPYAAWAKILDVNLTGLFMLTQSLLPLLENAAAPQDPARVINLGSVMGSTPLGDGAYSYSASKAAVHHLTRILAKELAHRHITFNAFAPGPFQSKMTAFATQSEAQAKKVGAAIPLGRIGTPDDIAAATLYLCGKGGSYITGAILPIDGGIHVQTGPELFS